MIRAIAAIALVLAGPALAQQQPTPTKAVNDPAKPIIRHVKATDDTAKPVVKHVVHHRVAHIPMPQPKPTEPVQNFTSLQAARDSLAQGTTAPKAKLTSQQVQQNPLQLIQTFTVTDLQAALADAQAQTPPDVVAANCYSALIPIVQTQAANPFPTTPGAFDALQKARDAKALLANLQSSNGPLANLNIACAPLVLDTLNTLAMLGIQTGAVAATISSGGLTLPFLNLLPIKLP